MKGNRTVKFDYRKLPKASVQTLRRIEVSTFAPLETLVAPVYVYLQQNQKFVAIKAPLHYFLPEELQKLKPYKNFYVPEFVDSVLPYQRAGESVRTLLSLVQKSPVQTQNGVELAEIPPPQHEIDHAVLHLIGTLWNPGAKVEPFFLHFFASEVCVPISEKLWTTSHDEDIERFELALLRSSTVVFLALHLGYCQRESLTRLRDESFSASFSGNLPPISTREQTQLIRLVSEVVPDCETREITLDTLLAALTASKTYKKTLRKLEARLQRIQTEMIRADVPAASLYGPKGIRNG
jgi:hypothetical protein